MTVESAGPAPTYDTGLLQLLNAANQGGPRQPGKSRETDAPTRLDANQDGKVSMGEMSDFADRNRDGRIEKNEMNDAFDFNNDGKVTQAEFQRASKTGEVAGDTDRRSFNEIDTNKDGVLSRHEQKDRNGDGEVTEREESQFQTERRRENPDESVRSYDDMDRNGDLHISGREMADTNNDGMVTKDEAKAFERANPNMTRDQLIKSGAVNSGEADTRSFSELDKDKNGKISQEEKANTNGDDHTSWEEWQAFKKLEVAETRNENTRSFADADTDGDGELSARETADTDNNGRISKDEAIAFREENPNMTRTQLYDAGVLNSGSADSRTFAEMDRNNDGKIGKHEKGDVNGDGILTDAEKRDRDTGDTELTADESQTSFSEMDRNDDGFVSAREMADTNNDGHLNAIEAKDFAESNKGKGRPWMARVGVLTSGQSDYRTFEETDTNNDGRISRGEKADLDGNRKVSDEEKRSYYKEKTIDDRDPDYRSFDETDKNDDGFVTRDEQADYFGDPYETEDEANFFVSQNPETNSARYAWGTALPSQEELDARPTEEEEEGEGEYPEGDEGSVDEEAPVDGEAPV